MIRRQVQIETPPAARLAVRLACDARDLRAAQRLRYTVFIEELGGTGPLVDHAQRLERDTLDPLLDHLLLVDTTRDPDGLDHVVGAYRLLPGTRLDRTGGFYCDTEFDLTPLRRSGRRLLELGRSCIAPAHRGGLGMMQLWQGLADYIRARDVEILFGAASFQGTDPQRFAQALSYLHHDHLAPEALRVRALDLGGFRPLPRAQVDRVCAMAQMPPLVRGYLRLGGTVGEGVFVDHAFRTTDVCVILDTARLAPQAVSLNRRAPR
ncbi:MAG: l-ornithine N(alpha)-acyltransferase [Roseinatronobacter sp.]